MQDQGSKIQPHQPQAPSLQKSNNDDEGGDDDNNGNRRVALNNAYSGKVENQAFHLQQTILDSDAFNKN